MSEPARLTVCFDDGVRVAAQGASEQASEQQSQEEGMGEEMSFFNTEFIQSHSHSLSFLFSFSVSVDVLVSHRTCTVLYCRWRFMRCTEAGRWEEHEEGGILRG